MTKKVGKASSVKNQTKLEDKYSVNSQLKAFAMKKLHKVEKRKISPSKISKTSFAASLNPNENFKVQNELFKEIVQQSSLQCPICLELMIEPTLLQCGHAYCGKCIQELMIYKSSCGVCRHMQYESEFQRSKNLETLIEKLVLQKSQKCLDYYVRLADVQNWKKVRNVSVSELSKGSFVDFRDKQLKWRKGEIAKIQLIEKKSLYMLTIRYKKENELIEETIESDSGRYAKFSYYTRMKYLEPKPYLHLVQNFVNEEILFTPLMYSTRDLSDQIEFFSRNVQEETLQENEELSTSFYQPSVRQENEEDELLDLIFQADEHRDMEFIQLLV